MKGIERGARAEFVKDFAVRRYGCGQRGGQSLLGQSAQVDFSSVGGGVNAVRSSLQRLALGFGVGVIFDAGDGGCARKEERKKQNAE